MKKGLYILSIFAILVFASCEKCEKPVMTEDPFSTNYQDRSQSSKDGGIEDVTSLRGGEDGESESANGTGGITDPEEDADFDGIVDPDEDADFDKDGDGK